MKLGEYIKQYRTTHGLSQRAFASMCGLSYGYISMLEKGVNTSTGAPIVPTLQTMRCLAQAMGTSIHKIASEVEDLYMDLAGDDIQPPLFSNLNLFSDKQPTHVGGLSIETQEIAEISESLPPDVRRMLLLQVRALRQEIPDPDAPE